MISHDSSKIHVIRKVFFNDSLLASAVIGGGIGFVMSPFSTESFVIVLGGIIIITLFSCHRNPQYDFAFKLVVVISYIFGYLLGKNVNDCDVHAFSEKHDRNHMEFVREVKGLRNLNRIKKTQ